MRSRAALPLSGLAEWKGFEGVQILEQLLLRWSRSRIDVFPQRFGGGEGFEPSRGVNCAVA
jgi:hypothetical protein